MSALKHSEFIDTENQLQDFQLKKHGRCVDGLKIVDSWNKDGRITERLEPSVPPRLFSVMTCKNCGAPSTYLVEGLCLTCRGHA